MARIDTLSNFLTDVSSAIKQKTGGSSPIPASSFDTEILSITTGGTYQTKSQSITTNGNYIITPDTGYDAIEQLNLSVAVPENPHVHVLNSLTELEALEEYINGDIYLLLDTRKEEWLPISYYSRFQECYCPDEVVLDNAVIMNIAQQMQRFNGSSTVNSNITITPTSVSFQGNDSVERIHYTSSDGITYTRTSSEYVTFDYEYHPTDYSTQSFGSTTNSSVYNNIISNFIYVKKYIFTGIYEGGVNNTYHKITNQLNSPPSTVANTTQYYSSASSIQTGLLPVVTYPIDPANPLNWNYQFIASTSNPAKVTRDGVQYIMIQQTVMSSSEPDNFIIKGNRKLKMGVDYTRLSNAIGLRPQYIKDGVTILNVTGTYNPSGTATILEDGTKFGRSTVTGFPSTMDFSEITDYYYLFYDCNQLVSVPSSLNLGLVSRWYYTFYNCYSLVSLGTVATIYPNTSMWDTFYNCKLLASVPTIDCSNMASDNDFQATFNGCEELTNVTLTNIPISTSSFISNHQSLSSMFRNCKKLTTISGLNNITPKSVNNMFYNCEVLTTVPSMNTSYCTDFGSMCYGCQSLTTVPIMNMNAVGSLSVSYLRDMFKNCPNLTTTSLDNILASLISIGNSTASNRTLAYIGLSSTQATTCTTLSNWSTLSSRGWTTGY